MARISTFSRYLLVTGIVAGCMVILSALAADDGYPGLIAPTHDDNNSTPNSVLATSPNNPLPAAQAPGNQTPALSTETPAQTPIPNYNPVIDDLGRASIIYGAKQGLTPPVTDYSAVQHVTIAGKPAVVYVIELRIKQAMAPVNDTSLSDSDRAQSAKDAFKTLSALADTLQNKQMIPDSIYKSLKLSDQYIKDERDGNDQALTELDTALDQLKPLQ